MVSYIENAIKSMEELNKAVKKCDFNAVRLSATTMRFLDSALTNGEITQGNYYTTIDRLGIMTDNIVNNCVCKKTSR